MEGVNKIGIIFAPGQVYDRALNQYVRDFISDNKWSPNFFRRLSGNCFEFEEPSLSASSIENSIEKLIEKRNCSEIHILGEQCAYYVSRYINESIHKGHEINANIIFANYPDHIHNENDSYSIISEQQYEVRVENYHESLLAKAFGKSVSYFTHKYYQKYCIWPNVAFITAAPVPIIQKWNNGFVEGFDSIDNSSTLYRYSLGTGYSKFSDPISGYQLAKYLIDTYEIHFFVQLCGASSIGLVKAINDEKKVNFPIYYFPFDYYRWEMFSVDGEIRVPLSLVRRIDHRITPIKSNRRYDISGTIFMRKTELPFIEDEKLDEIQKLIPMISFEKIQ